MTRLCSFVWPSTNLTEYLRDLNFGLARPLKTFLKIGFRRKLGSYFENCFLYVEYLAVPYNAFTRKNNNFWKKMP